MAKVKTAYVCRDCGADYLKWQGQCGECKAWNSLDEFKISAEAKKKSTTADTRSLGNYSGSQSAIQTLDQVNAAAISRKPIGISELDRVLGGGIVDGAVMLVGGDPGIGKSTLLLQMQATLAEATDVLYISGEESPEQISLRAERLGLNRASMKLIAETSVDSILKTLQTEKPSVVVIDSIQTIFLPALSSAPGSVSQLRECTAEITRFAKQTGTSIFIIGHVTKEGAIAGPRVLEHIVDTVLYFEGDNASRFRILRAIKNRFGPANEMGVFAMQDDGLKPVSNPSAIFLTHRDEPAPGSAVLVNWEGTRPILVEIQALVDSHAGSHPKRVTLGVDQNRLAMLLAVMSRHAGVAMYDQDVFVNAVGGVKITETAADLAVIIAALSSLRSRPIPKDTICFGEIGLSGEIRPVPNGEARLQEASKQGFTRAICPHHNLPRKPIKELEIHGIKSVNELLPLL
jgi:DNA repair protein RadA/Sms